MFIKDLVSIVTPCYNGEKYLDNYFHAILSQTYNNIEIILVDDGSTDNSKKKIQYWEPKIIKRGYSLKYVHQKNGGLPNAINAGLKHVKGEFLIWPDCDDCIYPNNSIEIRVDFFNKNKNIGIVRGKAEYVHENNPNKVLYYIKPNHRETNDMFMDIIFERTYITPGTYMVRTSYLKEVNPLMKIWDKNRAGQNWQMLLPLVYKYQVGFVNNVVHRYFYHPTSMSHNIDHKDKYKWHKDHYKKHKEILYETIKSIHTQDEEQLLFLIDEKYNKMNFMFAVKYNSIENLSINYKLLPRESFTAFERLFISLSFLLKSVLIIKTLLYVETKANAFVRKLSRRFKVKKGL